MPLSAEDRAAFVALLPHLAPGASRDPVHAFVRDHWSDALEELGADPGFDQVRAGMIRVAGDLLDDRDEAVRSARAVLDRYPATVAEGDAMTLVARHPAWVGICVLELGRLADTPAPAALDRAVALAAVGFAESTGEAQERGRILWAMAEQLEEVDWRDRAREVWEAAVTAGLSDPDDHARVSLLLALRLAEDDDPGALEALDEVASTASLARARVHAMWVTSAIHRRRGQPDAARRALQRALSDVDEEDEPEIANTIASALDTLGSDG